MRLITRSDFDGLACSALLEAMGLIDDWLFVHPKDIQDGLIKATKSDVLANVPYVAGCGLWFDHHSSEEERLGKDIKFEGVSRKAPSCARVIYDYYGGDEKLGKFAEMVKYVDKVDSANLTIDEIKKQGFEDYYVDHTLGIYPIAASGTPYSAGWFQSKGDPITDLVEDLAAEGATL
jgi:oligoribonuclease NrnB/cAMP/cGMP phosphodiesterase (DHH superfamily)